ncbi:MAG: multidrug ABC transporter ATP-binding protein, partial [SAR86 cluster bacterium]
MFAFSGLTANSEPRGGDINKLLIETKDLRLDYGELTAVNNVCLQISAGEIYGLVGPNGAGKTSLLKMLANLHTPTYGEISICGVDLSENPRQVYQTIGYMPDLSPVAPELKVWEFLHFFAASYGIAASKIRARVDSCLELVQMQEHRNVYGKELSRGMMQRVVLAKTLIPKPRVLMLDEPASGMDPLARINLKNILLTLSDQGVTTIVSSHILTELADMCTSVGIMDKGVLLKSGAIEAVLNESSASSIQLSVLSGQETALKLLAASVNVIEVKQHSGGISFNFSSDEAGLAELLQALIAAGVKVTGFYKK